MTWTVASAWILVLASGLYHGCNPAMGWPLAVAAGLMERRPGALLRALVPLAAGHFAAMLALLVPFAALLVLAQWQRSIQLTAGLLVVGFGLARLLYRGHPRALARIPPSRLALWSFAIAVAHGAGLMLVPIYLGMCRPADFDAGHLAAAALMGSSLLTAMLVAAVHSLAMLAAGGTTAWITFRYVGLAGLRRRWRDDETLWASSLILAGGLALVGSW